MAALLGVRGDLSVTPQIPDIQPRVAIGAAPRPPHRLPCVSKIVYIKTQLVVIARLRPNQPPSTRNRLAPRRFAGAINNLRDTSHGPRTSRPPRTRPPRRRLPRRDPAVPPDQAAAGRRLPVHRGPPGPGRLRAHSRSGDDLDAGRNRGRPASVHGRARVLARGPEEA